MKTDGFELSLLYDYYGETLTEKQRRFFELYYNQDLSLGEIAELEGISRQGVRDAIARAESALRALEQQIGCVAQRNRTAETLGAIEKSAQALAASCDPEIRRRAGEILDAVRQWKE